MRTGTTIALSFALALLCSAANVDGAITILGVDFDSLATGEIDNSGATTAQLNAATTGGTWDLNSDPISSVTHQIQDDAAGGGSTDRGFSSRVLTNATYGAGIDLDTAVDIDAMTNDLVITLTSGTSDGTGFNRNGHWRLFDDTTQLLDVMLDDGSVWFKGSTGSFTNLGSLFSAADGSAMGQTWNTSSGFLLDISLTIDNAGNVDLSVNDHGGGGTTDTVMGSKTITLTADFDRLQISWDGNTRNASNQMGVYLGEVSITTIPEPSTFALAALGLLGLLALGRRRRP